MKCSDNRATPDVNKTRGSNNGSRERENIGMITCPAYSQIPSAAAEDLEENADTIVYETI